MNQWKDMKTVAGDRPQIYQHKLSRGRKVAYVAAAVGMLLAACISTIALFPDPVINWLVKPKVVEAAALAFPDYSIKIADIEYNVFTNRFACNSVVVGARDSSLSGMMGSFSLRGVSWIHLLWGGTLVVEDVADVVFTVRDIGFYFSRAHYEFRCKLLRISVRDSDLVAESVSMQPLGGDEEYFGASEFRSTRFRLTVPEIRMNGLSFRELLQGNRFRTRSVRVGDAYLDVLVNKDKPNIVEPSSPLTPTELLSSFDGVVHVDSVSITNGRLMYSERFEVGAKPSWITLDSVQMLARGIANDGDRDGAMALHAQWKLANAGTMTLLMSVPVSSQAFSFKYSGTLSTMNINAFNSFLETAEQIRIKEGLIESVTYEINVDSGRSSGTVQGIYRDLTLASIDKYTGNEKGFANGLTSFIANVYTIRRANPDRMGKMKIGEVKYVRERDDPFIRFVWFSLRTGVRDVVGF